MRRVQQALPVVVMIGVALVASVLFGEATVRGRIVDQATGQPLAARLYLQSADGAWHFPQSAVPEGTAVEYRESRSDHSQEMHVTLSAHPFTVTVPAGTLTVTVERGKEYVPLVREFDARDGETLDLELRLQRWVHMAARGWYSADMHFHRPLAETPNIILAEDLNVAFPVSHWATEAYSAPAAVDRNAAPSSPDPILVDAEHLIHPLNTEYEIFTVDGQQHTLGAVLIIGQRTVFTEGAPPVKRIAAQAHADGALIDLDKHSWPWSIAIVPVMKVNLFELANNHVWRTEFGFRKWTLDAIAPHMQLEVDDEGFTEWGWIDFGFQTYYGLLNCSLKLKPSAGTASGVHPVPAGFGRVYVNLDSEFTFDNFFKALKAGRSFVTTGPMLDVRFNDQLPGHDFESPDSFTVALSGAAESLQPLDRIEVIVNGDVMQTIIPENAPRRPAGFQSRIAEAIQLDRSGWIAVRCFERHPQRRIRFAHTAPVHVTISGKPPRPKAVEVQYFVHMVQRELDRLDKVLPEAALDEYRQALQYYRGQLDERAE